MLHSVDLSHEASRFDYPSLPSRGHDTRKEVANRNMLLQLTATCCCNSPILANSLRFRRSHKQAFASQRQASAKVTGVWD